VPLDPLETYLRELNTIRSSGAATDETPYYGHFETLLNTIGAKLKPKVKCIINLKNRGAGFPDGGLFTQEQLCKVADGDPIKSQIPARGAIEIKPPGENVLKTAWSQQGLKYLRRYGLLLITNYREFVLFRPDPKGNPERLESYVLARDESEFWTAASQPRKTAREQSERLTEFLKRVMLHRAPLGDPEDVAWFLASYAREAKARIEGVDLPALSDVRKALEGALGLKFEGEKGDHFFRSSLVQTLFYGVFSAWVLWSKENPPSKADARFEWRMAQWSLRVPMLRVLYEKLATPTRLAPLDLVEVLNWTQAVLNRVDRAEFFSKFEEGQAVQYFYEPFLKAFDPELRKELGVWYTPPEIVRYMVARVDTVLREELGVEDGLADPSVYVLDPCCGTGAYLVEVLKRIAETLKEKGSDALLANDLKRAAMERVFGFEILPAPFVVSHLQLGLLLQSLGAPLSHDENERVGVYLTNALTGWELRDQPPLAWPELEAERQGSGTVKREKPILVILGNPPYNAFAGVSPEEEEGLVEVYKGAYFATKKNKKTGRPVKDKRGRPVTQRHYLLSDPDRLGGWGIKKFNLDDLYVRFFRLAERRIAEKTGRGIVCYISNHSWVSEPSFVLLRKHLLDSFDRFWIENLHGNRKISEYAPDGRTSETVFAIPGFSPGIRQGVVTSLWVKSGRRDTGPRVLFRDDIDAARAVERRAELLDSVNDKHALSHYIPAHPTAANRFSFRPADVAAHYLAWPRVTDLCAEPPSNGLMEKRGGALIDIDKEPLERRMRRYYDSTVEWEALVALDTGLTKKAARFDPKRGRRKVLAAEQFSDENLRGYALRPFDHRWCYYSSVRPLWNEPRPSLFEQCWEGNSFVATRPAGVASPEGTPFYYTRAVPDNDLLRGHAYYFPVLLQPSSPGSAKRDNHQRELSVRAVPHRANSSSSAGEYVTKLGLAVQSDSPQLDQFPVWLHVLAIGYSPAYLTENADGIRQDWPRIPLPDSRDLLLASAELGRKVAALLDTEAQVGGVTSGNIRPELKPVGLVSKEGGGSLGASPDELAITAGWGHAGKGGAVMPGKGKLIERDYSAQERAAIEKGAQALGLTLDQALERLGDTTCDVHLNDVAYWKNIPGKAWDYYIGGYQVVKKWLSYRELKMLGRPLRPEEAREVTNMARRIVAILLLEPALDENYRDVKANTYAWPMADEQPQDFNTKISS